jgi:parallel beta-helix repeat protein
MKNLIPRLLISLLAVSVAHGTPVKASVVHVPGDVATIKAGIGLASAGDTVLVACGTYNEHNIRMKSGVVLLSETGQPDCVTIDAQQQDRVIYGRGVGSTTIIEGITITGGLVPQGAPGEPADGGGLYFTDNSSLSIINCIIANNEAPYDGGGVYVANSTPTFVNCTITQNEAGNGGSGIRFEGGFWGASAPILIDCSITDNVGTGIWAVSSSPVLNNCSITGNSRAGISCQGSSTAGISITLTDCTMSGNSGNVGGALKVWASSATLTNCTLSDNSASEGAGLYVIAGDATLTDCVLTGNSAQRGGGIYLRTQDGTSDVSISNTEFSNNTATQEGAHGFVEGGSEAILTCSVDDLVGFAGGGTITLENEACLPPVNQTTWGHLKALYR